MEWNESVWVMRTKSKQGRIIQRDHVIPLEKQRKKIKKENKERKEKKKIKKEKAKEKKEKRKKKDEK